MKDNGAETMTVREAREALDVCDVDYVTRLLRSGRLVGWHERGRWVIDAASVAKRKRQTDRLRENRQNAAARREQLRAEAAARYAKP